MDPVTEAVAVVPPVPVAAPVVAPVAVPPAAPVPVPAPVAVAPVAPAPVVATPRPSVDDLPPEALKERLARERTKAFKDAGFESEEQARLLAAERAKQIEAEKATLTKLSEAQTLAAQLKQRSDAVTSLLAETANESFGKLTDAQKAAVRLQANDDAPAEDRIKAIRMVRAMAEALTPSQPASPVTPVAAPAPTPVTPTTVPPTDTAPGRTQPNGDGTTPPNHRATYEALVKTNPFAAAAYGQEHPEAYKSA